MEYIFFEKKGNRIMAMTRTKGFKEFNHTNPIITQRFGADPYAMEYDGRIYVYMTNDAVEIDDNGVMRDNTYSKINTINCISSADLVNWTDHGSLPIAGENGAAKWARNSWAPAAVHKKINGVDKFFLYFADSGKGIGVVTSDTPIGPWVDPIGKPLANQSVPGCEGVVWCFDPAVWVDDDNRAFLYFGGGIPHGKAAMPNTARAVELGDDMISLKGTPVVIEAPYIFEDSGINKIGDTYYYSYCTNFMERNDPDAKIVLPVGQIHYMTSKNPLGPFEYQKGILRNPGDFNFGGGNNHHCIAKFKGEYYMFWHTQTLALRMELPASGYRNTHVDKMVVNSDGTINDIEASYIGVTQLEGFNPYVETATDTFAFEAGIKFVPSVEDSRVMKLTGIDTGDYIGIKGVEFEGTKSLILNIGAKTDGNRIHVVLGHPDEEATLIVDVPVTEGGNPTKVEVKLDNIVGNKDLFFLFEGSDFSFDSWMFVR